MDLSLAALERAVGIRRQIAALEKQLNGLFGGAGGGKSSHRDGSGGRRHLSASARAKIAAAARARWARERAGRGGAKGKAKSSARRGGGLTAAGRKKLSDMMKARWAARRRAKRK